MTLLQFKDESGREWEVWEVGARPPLADRPTTPGADPAPRWLCFASGTERRRLTIYPPRWSTLSPADLDVLCRRATPARQVPYSELPSRPRANDR